MADENTTILILKGVKRVRSIKINRRRIRLAIYAASVFSITLVLSIGLNIYQFTNPGFPGNLTGIIPAANQETVDTRNFSSPQISSSNQDFSNDNFASSDESTNRSNGENSQIENDTEAVEEKGDIFSGDIDSKMIGFDNWIHSLSADARELEISFEIYKKDNSSNTVSGTIIILAKTNDKNNPYISDPDVGVSTDGKIPNYFRGEYFSMSIRTPEKTGRLVLTDDSASFEYYRILVFSSSGEILLQQTRSLRNSF